MVTKKKTIIGTVKFNEIENGNLKDSIDLSRVMYLNIGDITYFLSPRN
jgi:hypothetical protein